jgi:hypothetical protein
MTLETHLRTLNQKRILLIATPVLGQEQCRFILSRDRVWTEQPGATGSKAERVLKKSFALSIEVF